MSEHGLGRIRIADERDKKFSLATLLEAAPDVKIVRKNWYPSGWWGDQGPEPKCVGYMAAHWLEDGPVSQPGRAPVYHPDDIYRRCKEIDGWPGEDGTTLRAAMKALQERGFIGEYRWGWTLQETVDAALTLGPVMVGTEWYGQMFYPDQKGIIRIGNSRSVGGHAYLINGVDIPKGLFRIKNSWGREWGVKGMAWIPFEDMERLIKEWGEICFATEVKKVK